MHAFGCCVWYMHCINTGHWMLQENLGMTTEKGCRNPLKVQKGLVALVSNECNYREADPWVDSHLGAL